jgi:hypothetical protein
MLRACLASLRLNSPNLPICIIPFNDRIETVKDLAQQFGCTVYDDAAHLSWCTSVGLRLTRDKRLTGCTCQEFRKLAIFNGPFDEFLYLDVDTIVLLPLDYVFNILNEGFDMVTAESHHSIKWVWQASIYTAKCLTPEQIAISTNSGFIAARRGLFTKASIEDKLTKAIAIRDHMVFHCIEQAFINFLIAAGNIRHMSLSQLLRKDHRMDIPQELWAGETKYGMVKGGTFRFRRATTKVALIHWAGCWQPKWYDKVIATLLCKRSIPPRLFMPCKKLWLHYYNMSFKGNSPF